MVEAILELMYPSLLGPDPANRSLEPKSVTTFFSESWDTFKSTNTGTDLSKFDPLEPEETLLNEITSTCACTRHTAHTKREND